MPDLVNYLILLFATILAIFIYFQTTPEEVLFHNKPNKRKLRVGAIAVMLLMIVQAFLLLVKDKMDEAESESKDRRISELIELNEFQMLKLDSQSRVLDSLNARGSTTLANTDKLLRSGDTMHFDLDTLKEGNKKIQIASSEIFKKVENINLKSGTPVFELCRDNRIVFEQEQAGSGTYALRVNFCTDRDVNDVQVMPYFFSCKGNNYTAIHRESKRPWSFPAMSQTFNRSAAGNLPIETRPDTLFVYFEGNLKNNDGAPFAIDLAYFTLWGSNKWFIAPPDVHAWMKEFVGKYMRHQ